MTRILLSLTVLFCLARESRAQKISIIEQNGNKLMMADMTPKGKVPWGGYEQIGEAARSNSDGALNTKAIVVAVGNNPHFDNKPYAAAYCDSLKAGGFDDWYLPAKDESDIIAANFPLLKLDEKMTLWTSTEANGTQAVTKYLYSNEFYNMAKVDVNHFVCVRKVK